MKRMLHIALWMTVLNLMWTNVFALLEFPSSLSNGSQYEGGTLAPASTNSSFFQNLLKRINFGTAATAPNTPVAPTTQTTPVQSTQSQNIPTPSNIFNQNSLQTPSYTDLFQTTPKQTQPTTQNTAPTITKDPVAGITTTTGNSTPTQTQTYLTQEEIVKKFEKFILDINKARSGYSATPTPTQMATPTPPQTQAPINQNNATIPQQNGELSPQQQAYLIRLISGNTVQTKSSMCEMASTPSEVQSCTQQLRISCQRSYLTGSPFFEECSQLPASTYANLQYNSQPTYTLDNYISHDNYYKPVTQTINVTQQNSSNQSANSPSFPGQYFSKEGNYIGPERVISGIATHYACNKKNGQYTIDTNLITRYKYITAYGIKAMWGIKAGDDKDSCNFNYCGVAVPQRFVISTYGSVSAGKNQLIQITNVNNLKCTVAPIQDFSATQDRILHPGSNAIIDLSLCVMERLGGYGKINVQYRPLKKGEVGCNQTSVNK